MKKSLLIIVLIALAGCYTPTSFEEACKSANWMLNGDTCSFATTHVKHSFTWNCNDGNRFVYHFEDIKEYKEPKSLARYLRLHCRDLVQR